MDTLNFILIIGVSGSGKTTVGKTLAKRLMWDFYDADDFHPSANITKMAQGIPLNDADRMPWLGRLQQLINTSIAENKPGILACSALKESYRKFLIKDNPGIRIVFLKGSYDLILSRMKIRSDHYMQPNMLESQFNTLEEPGNALFVDINQPVEKIVDSIVQELSHYF